jgi:hypothetical protein
VTVSKSGRSSISCSSSSINRSSAQSRRTPGVRAIPARIGLGIRASEAHCIRRSAEGARPSPGLLPPFCRAAEAKLTGVDQATWLARLRVEHSNISLALDMGHRVSGSFDARAPAGGSARALLGSAQPPSGGPRNVCRAARAPEHAGAVGRSRQSAGRSRAPRVVPGRYRRRAGNSPASHHAISRTLERAGGETPAGLPRLRRMVRRQRCRCPRAL